MRLPKKIFIYWSQGHKNAPELVKQCITSWERLNPGWNVILIDDETTHHFVNMDKYQTLRRNLHIQVYANILRLELINQLGGIWVDATLFCCLPLNDWVDEDFQQDDLIVEKFPPSNYRCMTNSFIASQKNNYMLTTMLKKYVHYLENHKFQRTHNYTSKLKKKIHKTLKKILNYNRITTLLWLNPIINKWLKITPYFLFMHMWHQLTIFDNKFGQLWKKSHSIHGKSEIISKRHLYKEVTLRLKETITKSPPAFIKLDWKQKPILQENISCVEYLYSLNDKK